MQELCKCHVAILRCTVVSLQSVLIYNHTGEKLPHDQLISDRGHEWVDPLGRGRFPMPRKPECIPRGCCCWLFAGWSEMQPCSDPELDHLITSQLWCKNSCALVVLLPCWSLVYLLLLLCTLPIPGLLGPNSMWVHQLTQLSGRPRREV